MKFSVLALTVVLGITFANETVPISKADRDQCLQLGVPYKLYNRHHKSWFIADIEVIYHEEHHYYGYLFYGREERASSFMFNLADPGTACGWIHRDMAVELVLCDEEDQPAAVVQRFFHHETTLLVSKYGDNATNDTTIAHPVALEYVN
ncbi:hypothetical protein PENFLA_c015G06948 [Penicillium flavigenum]|uniref:AA1-like domain-containing protein n=1 Tax=Penicillium flavigenum TaxID=254877 RepID=A0A1V6T4M6_9EURO|nr:hypothetical protein PENFLA_c015G06948 [Penicillium flavigenum]